jgi:lycopene beta-cyclase
MTRVDLAILGGGCAGLSLARDLARQPQSGSRSPAKVVVIEPREHYEDDRTWCFWEGPDEEGDSLVQRRWHAWRFSTGAVARTQSSRSWAYCLVAGRDFYRDARETIAGKPWLELRLGTRVERVTPRESGIEVETSRGPLLASRVVDTRPPDFGKSHPFRLYQSFAGVEVACRDAPGDAQTAGLMEHMRTDERGFRFDYILPLGSGRWLIEATRFSVENEPLSLLQHDLDLSLRSILPAGPTEIFRREAGMIPMGRVAPRATGDPRWVAAGTGGGAVRAASGYAYKRIQRWSRLCARTFCHTGEVVGHPPDPSLRQAMDDLFLRVLRAEPERAPDLFDRLARRTRPETLARFMMDRAGPLELLSVALALPPLPFLRQIWKSRPANSSSNFFSRNIA